MKTALVEYYANLLPDIRFVSVQRFPKNGNVSPVPAESPQNQPQGGGFTRSVFANQAHNHAAGQFQM